MDGGGRSLSLDGGRSLSLDVARSLRSLSFSRGSRKGSLLDGSRGEMGTRSSLLLST